MTQKTDRELLELAAKAAGIEGEWSKTIGGWDCLITKRGSLVWQPLFDDGDAFRLAMKYGFTILPGMARDAEGRASIEGGTDVLAATRRAIVKVAAMQENSNDAR